MLGILSLLPLMSGCEGRFFSERISMQDQQLLHEAACHCASCREFCSDAALQAESSFDHEAARLLAAMAASQHCFEQLYITAIDRLGAQYDPPCTDPPILGGVQDNLLRAQQAANYAQQAPIAHFLAADNRYVARLMIRHVATENRMCRLIDLLLYTTVPDTLRHYLVCPACGYLSADDHPDPYCPQCLISAEHFLCF